MPSRALSILTVNHHSAASLLAAQETLAASPPVCDFEWIVVDHSAEGVRPIPDLEGRMTVLEQGNVGFGRGVNTAARAASAPILFLANPDLVFRGALIDQGLARLAAQPDIGLLGPRLVYPDGRVQRTARRFYTWPDALFARLPGRDRLPAPDFWRRHLMLDPPLNEPADVDWILGAALFVRRAALRRPVGPESVFDPRYFLYFEDVDLCMDLWSRGWRVRFDPTLSATHEFRRASGSLLAPAALHHAASFLKFVAKWRGLPRRPAIAGVGEAVSSRRDR